MKSLISCIFFVVFLFPSLIQAQNFFKEQIPRRKSFSIGFGPSFGYMDNGGQYRSGKFAVKPTFSGSYYRQLNQRIDLRATLGFQPIESSGTPSADSQAAWTANSAAFTTKGTVYFLDIMPTISIFPVSNQFNRSKFNFFGGLGLGVLQSTTKQTKTFDPNEIPVSHSLRSFYIPIRTGISFRLGAYSDISGEIAYFWTLTDMLEGNASTNSYNDQLIQGLVTYRRYLLPKSKP